MKIAAIRVYQVDLPVKEGRYAWSEGKYVEVFDSTVVEIETDDGRTGVGEVCPLGPFYLPAFGPGARAAIGELAPHLIGQDPCALGQVNQIMDMSLLGHPYAKSDPGRRGFESHRPPQSALGCYLGYTDRGGLIFSDLPEVVRRFVTQIGNRRCELTFSV